MNADDVVTVEVQHDTLAVNPETCRLTLLHVFTMEKVQVELVTLIQSDHSTVRRLNREYLHHDFNTDVLAFRYSDDHHVLEGEIYVDLDMALERCGEFNATFEEEVLRYAIHGALHLAGFSDESREDKRLMRALEDRYLAEIRHFESDN